jgi:hypothetical protein
VSYLRRLLVRGDDSPSVDAFSRWRVSDPVSLFDSSFQYDTQGLLWFTTTTTGGTEVHLPNESSSRLRVSTTSGASVIKQTREYIRYQPGRSQLILMTAVIGAANTNVKKRVGMFDANNGIFLEQTGNGTLDVVRRSFASGSAVDEVVAQSAWNLDRLDGTGIVNPSGITFDATKTHILVIDLQWLGVGRVRIGFDLGGSVIYVHEFVHANVLTSVYMTTANLPLRYEIVATGAAGAQTDLIAICSSVSSEGGFTEERAFGFSANNGIATISVTTRRAILSIRPKATFNSIVNRGKIVLDSIDLTTAGNPALWEVVYGATLGGTPAFGSVDADSIVESDVAGTTVTGGIVAQSGYCGTGGASRVSNGSREILNRLPLVLDAAGANPTNLSLVITSFTGTVTAAGSIGWRELR